MSHYIKEEIIHCHNIPALIKYQRLEGINCSVPLHWHKDIELNLMLNGIGEFTVNGEKTVIRSGDLILINSEDVHMGEPPLSIPLKERKLELITLLWDYDFLFQYADHISELRFQLDNFGVNDKKNISDMIRQIGSLYEKGAFCHEMDITALLLQIGSSLMKNCMVAESQLPEKKQKRTISTIQQAVHFIDENYTEPLTLEDVADRTGFAPAYFSRKFRQVTGVAYKDYLASRRLRNAVKDLTSTEMTVNEIAYENGFPNVKSFIELFKKEYGTTPQKYRIQ